MSLTNYIFQDWKANRENPTKGKIIVILFRIAQLVQKRTTTKVIFFLYTVFYRVVVEWLMCVEISARTSIGPNFQIWHGSGLVIHPNTIIGKNCSIRQCTTIGVKDGVSIKDLNIAPHIGDYVNIGCNTVIIGNINIGDHAIIGAGSVVVKSIQADDTVAGNPAKSILKNSLSKTG